MKRKSKKFLNAVMVLSVAMLWQTKARGEEITPNYSSKNKVVVTPEGEYKINETEKTGYLTKNDNVYGGKSSGVTGNNEDMGAMQQQKM